MIVIVPTNDVPKVDVAPIGKDPASEPEQPGTTDLIRTSFDSRVDSFQLQGDSWGFAYDAISGHLALTQDDVGVLIYDLKQLGAKRTKPVAKFEVDGLPTALAMKHLPDRRVFIFGGSSASTLKWIDVETLDDVGEMELDGIGHLGFLTTSLNPQDPYLYFLASQHRGPRPYRAETLGRVNLLTRVQDPLTRLGTSDVTKFTISDDGRRLIVRDTHDSCVAEWLDDLDHSGNSQLARTSYCKIDNTYANDSVYRLDNRFAVGRFVVDPSFSFSTNPLSFEPQLEFRDHNVVLGLNKDSIVVASSNDFRSLAEAGLKGEWKKENRTPLKNPNDFRTWPKKVPDIRARFFHSVADQFRGIGIICFESQLLLAHLDRFELPTGPNLVSLTRPPSTIKAGQTIEITLETPTDGVKIDLVPDTDGYRSISRLNPPWESLLGANLKKPDQRKADSDASPFLPNSFIDSEGNRVTLRENLTGGYGGFAGAYDASDDDLMRSFGGYGDSSNESTQIASGYVSSGPAAEVSTNNQRRAQTISSQRTIELAAAILERQDIVYVADIEKLAGLARPIRLRIDDEVMTVVEIDEFKEMIKVERPNPQRHDVDATVTVVGDEKVIPAKQISTPTIRGNLFRWTPGSDQVGSRFVRIRATKGKVSRTGSGNLKSSMNPSNCHFTSRESTASLDQIWRSSGGSCGHRK